MPEPKSEYSYVARYGEAITRGGIAAIPYALYHYQGELKLSPQLVWFTSAILGRKWTSQLPRPSLKKMAEQSGVSEQQLHNYKKKLVDDGWLIVINRYDEQGGQTSNYYDFSPLMNSLVELLERDNPERDEYLVRGLNASLAGGLKRSVAQGLNASLDKEEEEENEALQTDIYLSNIRKAKKEKNGDYVNSPSSIAKPALITPVQEETGEAVKRRGRPRKTDQGKAQPSQLHDPSKTRKLSSSQNLRPARDEIHEPPQRSSQASFTTVGDVLTERLEQRPERIEDREAIHDYMRDIAAELHDQAPLKSTVTRAYNLYVTSGVDFSRFINAVYDARKETQRRTASIKKTDAATGFKSKMAYFFAILEEQLGLRGDTASKTPSGSALI